MKLIENFIEKFHNLSLPSPEKCLIIKEGDEIYIKKWIKNGKINGTSATYDQANDLTREISLLAGLEYEKYVLDNGKVGFSINGKTTSQNTKGLSGNVSFKMNF